jgi:hypothetical protein
VLAFLLAAAVQADAKLVRIRRCAQTGCALNLVEQASLEMVAHEGALTGFGVVP